MWDIKTLCQVSFRSVLKRAKEKREKKNFCLLYVPHWIVVSVNLFFSLAENSCSVTRLFLFGWALKNSSFAILCERVASRWDNLIARIIPLRILFLSESISLDNLLSENELNQTVAHCYMIETVSEITGLLSFQYNLSRGQFLFPFRSQCPHICVSTQKIVIKTSLIPKLWSFYINKLMACCVDLPFKRLLRSPWPLPLFFDNLYLVVFQKILWWINSLNCSASVTF